MVSACRVTGRRSRKNTMKNAARSAQALSARAQEEDGLSETPCITKDRNSLRTWNLLFVACVDFAQGRSASQTDVAARITALKFFKRTDNVPERLVSGNLTGSRRWQMADLDHWRRRFRNGKNFHRLVVQRTHQQVHGFNANTRVGVVFERIEQGLTHVMVRRGITKSLEGLQTHCGILVLARGGQKSSADLEIGSAGLQSIQAIQANPGIKAFAVFYNVSQDAAHIVIIEAPTQS